MNEEFVCLLLLGDFWISCSCMFPRKLDVLIRFHSWFYNGSLEVKHRQVVVKNLRQFQFQSSCQVSDCQKWDALVSKFSLDN